MTSDPLLLIRKVTDHDLEDVAWIERHCFGHAWTRAQYVEGVLRSACCCGLVAVVDDRPVAFASVTCLAGQGYVPTFGVLQAYRRMGIGQRLLTALLDQARQMQAQEVVLEVRVSNLAAQRLYGQAGFAVLAVRKAYYEDPAEDGLVMVCKLG